MLRSALLLILSAVAAAPIAASRFQAPAPAAQTPAGRPKLVVFLVLDQFRADYIDMYGHQWTKGLRRLLDKGALFTEAAYPYAVTLTCAGHATIGTGAFPAVHGMASNDFYDRALRRLVTCGFDPGVRPVPFGDATGIEHHSARSLLAPTFAEELRRQSKVQTRVVSVAQKPRSSVTLAGRGHADTVAIWEEDAGTWSTSTMYTRKPWADVDEFVRRRPMRADYGKVWTLLMPPAFYKYVDDGAGEGRPAPWTRTFPHPVISTKKVQDLEFVNAWERSPLNDAFLADLAIHLLRSRKLGTGPGTDVLTLSMPCLDHNGHEFGPRSFEVQDILLRADANIGRLLDALDEQVPGQYVLGFTADHGVAMIPEQMIADKQDAGRISGTQMGELVDKTLVRILGGTEVSAVVYDQQVVLTPGGYDQLRARPGAIDTVKAAIGSVPGVAGVYSVDEIAGGAASDDPRIRAWRLSYVPGRMGDFMLVLKPNWILRSTSGTTHGTLNAHDQRVPVLFFGAGIKPGRYAATSSPADLAPTFAHLTGIVMPRAQGRALTDALVK